MFWKVERRRLFSDERAWSYLTSSCINMGLSPFQPNPRGLCCLLNHVFSSGSWNLSHLFQRNVYFLLFHQSKQQRLYFFITFREKKKLKFQLSELKTLLCKQQRRCLWRPVTFKEMENGERSEINDCCEYVDVLGRMSADVGAWEFLSPLSVLHSRIVRRARRTVLSAGDDLCSLWW